MKRASCLGLACAVMFGAAGCGATTATTGADSTGNGSSDAGGGTTGDGSTGADASGGNDSAEFTASSAKTAAEDAASVLAQSLIAVLTVKDLEAIFEGGASSPTCPSMEATIDPGAVVLSLDFASGCTPAPYTVPVLQGVASADVFTSISAFEAALDSIQFDGVPVAGTVTGTFATSEAKTVFVLTPSVTRDGSMSYTGTAAIVFDEATGALTIESASLTVAGADVSLSILISDAGIDPDGARGTTPGSGGATVANLQGASSEQEFEIAFGG